MGSVAKAILVSVGVHLLIAVAFVAYLDYGIRSETSVTLDLSALELSVAEEDDETAETRPQEESAPEASAAPRPLPPPALEAVLPVPLPPESAAVVLPEPEEPRPEIPSAAPQPQTAAPRQAKIDAPPQPKRNIRPDYPRLAKLRGEEGDVVLEIEVASDGYVSSVTVVDSSGFASLDEAAVKAARSASFRPAKADGRPVASVARITLKFQLK